MGSVRGLLFDIGGVLVALDGVPCLATLLGVEAQHDVLHARWVAAPSVIAHETGQIEASEFATRVVADLGLRTTPDDFLRQFDAWLQGPLPGAGDLLAEIPDQYLVAALSNMSAVHWHRIVETGVTTRITQLYLSHETGFLKPAKEAYLAALMGMDLAPADVLFIDDGARNVEAARALGLSAELARGPKEARAVLVRYGVLSEPRAR